MYEAYIETNADNWQGIAYYTKDSAVTHKEFREAVDCLSAAIYDAMQKENLRVGALLNCYEETPVCLLAINKIGGVIKYIDYSKEISDVVDNIIESRFDMLIIDEAFIEIEKRSNTRSAPVIVVRGTRNYDTGHYISYETMITKGASCNNHMTGYKPNKPALIISSSGTTGAPKSIVHSNETVLAAVDKILYTDLMIKRHNLMINAIPPFIGLGIVTTIYTSLIAGMSLIFIQGIAMQEFPIGTSRFISMFADFKRKFNISDEIKLNLFAAPIFFRIIANFP